MQNQNIDKNSAIGILDSGVGGLTVVKAVKQLMPQEDIIFFGDSLHCPYGNKSKEEILQLTNKIIAFLKEKKVKILALACNTMSTLSEELKKQHEIEIVDIISPTVAYIAKLNLKELGLLATSFTVNSQRYDKLLGEKSQDLILFSQASKNLAKIIEDGKFDEAEEELQREINKILEKKANLEDIVLACTHYPIIEHSFKKFYPNISFINPAIDQANALREFLAKNHLLTNKNSGKLELYSSGNIDKFEFFLKKLKLPEPEKSAEIKI